MSVDRMQQQRFELKYLVREEMALRMRDFVQSYLNLDEYSVCKPNLSYAVHSMYLDSDDLKMYWDTINGNKNRYKLRLRYYSTQPDVPIFFEVKRRMNSCIMKQRGGVRYDAVEHLLSGHLPAPEHLLSNSNPRQFAAVQRFCQLMHEIQAKPKVHIAYMREAYVSDNDQVRLTLDRTVRSEPNLFYNVCTEMSKPRTSYDGWVILELKFTNRYPNWFRELVRVFGVMQRGAAKYCSSVQAIGAEALEAKSVVVQDEESWVQGTD